MVRYALRANAPYACCANLPPNGGLAKLDNDGILLGSCEEGKGVWLKAGADDRSFRLERVAMERCVGLAKAEFGE